jgi:tRNA (guanine-N7-)-methyltransferase
MSRALKYDIPGPDWRITPEEIKEKGLRESFSRSSEEHVSLVVDLGFGRGEFLLALVQKDPDTLFLGVEYSFKRVLKMARLLARSGLTRILLCDATAEEVVGACLPDASVREFYVNFPDPWPKKRHHRRRMLQPAFVAQIVRCLEVGGVFNVATDHRGYADWIDEVLSREPGLENLYAPDGCRDSVEGRPTTSYELEWRAEGRCFHFFRYGRQVGVEVPVSARNRAAELDSQPS